MGGIGLASVLAGLSWHSFDDSQKAANKVRLARLPITIPRNGKLMYKISISAISLCEGGFNRQNVISRTCLALRAIADLRYAPLRPPEFCSLYNVIVFIIL